MYHKHEYKRKFDCHSHTQIPDMPILKAKSLEEIIDYVYDSIVQEAITVEFYSCLLKEAPDELHKCFIHKAHQDELLHLYAFTKLFCHLTGNMPQYTITPIKYRSYREALLIAYKDELEVGQFYRDMQLYTSDLLIKDTFYYAMVDELEHATMFSTLYLTCRC